MGVYVVQVIGGRESTARSLLYKHAFDCMDECFLPKYELMKRKEGEWHKVKKPLFPGYLFVRTNNPEQLSARMRAIPVFMRLLGSNDQFIPLAPDELLWFNTFTDMGKYLVEMSRGVIEGDRVIVTEGPLKGHEALITKINRHKRLAYVDLHMFGRDRSVSIGLEIVRKAD